MSDQQEAIERAMRKTRTGTVISDKMDKTVIVRVQTLKEHSKYKKHIRQSTKFKAHDEQNQCKVGDRVRIMETRPLSHDKRWRNHKIVLHPASLTTLKWYRRKRPSRTRMRATSAASTLTTSAN